MPQSEWPHRHAWPLAASADGRYLATTDGQPFYYCADTQWPLLWHYTLGEALEIAADRRRLGFTALQINLLPFGDARNRHGDRIFADRAALTPNEAYFAHADRVLDGLEALGFAVYVVVLWWNQIDRELRGRSPALCEAYGRWLGRRWQARANLIFVLGGDQRWYEEDRMHFRALAEGLRAANTTSRLLSFHPQSEHSSSEHLLDEEWLSLNSIQVCALLCCLQWPSAAASCPQIDSNGLEWHPMANGLSGLRWPRMASNGLGWH